MNNTGITDLILIYGISFLILMMFSVISIFRIIKRRSGKKLKEQEFTETPETSTNSSSNSLNRIVVPQRKLTSTDTDREQKGQNIALGKIELLSPLKRGIIWAEILGRPGGRKQRNT